jgi:predicted nuclease of predicted toxin-antitoxin system
VKLLLDECVTRHLKREFADHEVNTVEEAGFKGLENGNLLRAASGTYDVLVTVDRNLQYQQNLTRLEIPILILSAKRNSYLRLKPLIPRALKALETIKAGEIVLVQL